MVKNHLKTTNAPVTWTLKRKNIKFVVRPNPGGHKLGLSMPLALVFKNLLKKAKTTKEVKHILNKQEVLVNNKRRKDVKYPIGVMDVLSILKTKEYYRILFNQNKKLVALPIDKKEAEFKLSKINKKTPLKKGVLQLNLLDGGNVIVKKGTYKTKDTIVFDLQKKKIKEVLAFQKGHVVLLVEGKHTGKTAKVVEIKEKTILLESDKEKFETKKDYAFVIGKDKPIIKIPE